MENKTMTLEQFAEVINAADEWKLEFEYIEYFVKDEEEE